ncbi:MAG: hypothetical protein P8Y99_02260 [Calditrichaceae bacterium]
MKNSNIADLIGKKFKTKLGELPVLELLGKGKSGYSYLTKHDHKYYVLKIMHDEPCSYYSFDQNKVELEVKAYNKLIDYSILMPELICYDLENEYLVKEFIDGKTASEIIANDLISEAIIQQLFEIYRQVKQNRLNIDYFPANFIIKDQRLFYIDYECNQYSSEWNLPSWGLYYWANCEGFKNFLSTDDSTYINESTENGIPIKKPFENKVSAWLQKFDVGWSKFIEN